MSKIKKIQAREILDSRGNPTIEAKVTLENGVSGIASVPSGVSVGKYEALELRDNDESRYHGLGVLKAVKNINQTIAPKMIGINARDQLTVDQALIVLDGSQNKANLGANAILAVSLASCKAAAKFEKVPTYEHVAHLYGLEKSKLKIPTPILVLIEGGKHGAANLDFQEFQIIPSHNKSFNQGLRLSTEIYHTTREVLIKNNAAHSLGDEGGFTPNLFTNLDALEVLKQAIKAAHYAFRKDVFLSLDVAANTFYQDGRYKIKDRTMPMNTANLVEFYRELVRQFPLLALEDPFYEEDWNGWTKLYETIPQTIIVGDDLLATNKSRVEEAIKEKACSAILVKPNQIGTLAETIEVIKICRKANWKIIVSHRGGETNDDFIADFAVGIAADYVKFGAPARGERVSKYNRLLKIEQILTKRKP